MIKKKWTLGPGLSKLRPFWTHIAIEGAPYCAAGKFSPVYHAMAVRTFNGVPSEIDLRWARAPQRVPKELKLTYRGELFDTVKYYEGCVIKRRGHVLVITVRETDSAGNQLSGSDHFDTLVLDDGRGRFLCNGKEVRYGDDRD